MKISLIVAHDRNQIIGNSASNDLPWHLPPDLKRFKQLTMGKPIIMGRTTWESLPKKPLPGRLNIVLSSQSLEEVEGMKVCSSLQDAIDYCENQLQSEEVFIIGGAKVYASAFNSLKIDTVYKTIVAIKSNGDIKLPSFFETYLYKLVESVQGEYADMRYLFQTYKLIGI